MDNHRQQRKPGRTVLRIQELLGQVALGSSKVEQSARYRFALTNRRFDLISYCQKNTFLDYWRKIKSSIWLTITSKTDQMCAVSLICACRLLATAPSCGTQSRPNNHKHCCAVRLSSYLFCEVPRSRCVCQLHAVGMNLPKGVQMSCGLPYQVGVAV